MKTSRRGIDRKAVVLVTQHIEIADCSVDDDTVGVVHLELEQFYIPGNNCLCIALYIRHQHIAGPTPAHGDILRRVFAGWSIGLQIVTIWEKS